MHYSTKLLSNGRWGIYEGHTLLATIGCPRTCQRLVAVLNQRRCGKQLNKQYDLHFTHQNSSKGIEVEAELAIAAQEAAQTVG